MQEEWRPVVDWEGLYEVSNLGRVRSLLTFFNGKPLIIELVYANLYYYARFSATDIVTRKLVHRLVAEAFIPNPENLPEVHHIDENKANNQVSNLQWCTKQSNGAARNNYTIEQYSLDEQLLCCYKSAREAARLIGYPSRSAAINLASKTWPSTSCGFKWKRGAKK